MEVRGSLFCCFVDFRAAFDSVHRSTLWCMLAKLRINKTVLSLIQEMHSKNWARVILDTLGNLSKKIQIMNGLRQGCVLAPLLFSLFLSDLPVTLSKAGGLSPKMGGTHISCLLYADDLVITDMTELSLQKKLNTFHEYCKKKKKPHG